MNKRHFTLVEVLVVVGIIGILAGLVFPAVGMARQAGRRTECVSNQGQLMKLLTVSMQADDNYLVSGSGYGQNLDTNPAWTRHLYAKNRLTKRRRHRKKLRNAPHSLRAWKNWKEKRPLQAILIPF